MVQPQLPSDSNNIQRTAVVALARDCALGCCDFAADEACLGVRNAMQCYEAKGCYVMQCDAVKRSEAWR